MKKTTFLSVIFLLLALLLLNGCQWIGDGESDERVFGYAKNIALMRGHLQTALANSDVGAHGHAKEHSGHVMKEGNFSAIEEAIEARDPGVSIQLRLALSDLSAVDHSPARTREGMRLLSKALKALVPKNKLENPAFQARTMQVLLGAAEEEYGEAVNARGRITDLEEYQDAFGFILEAKLIYRGLSSQLGSDSREIDKLFEELTKAFKSIAAPSKMVPAKTVSATVNRLNQKLGQAVGSSEN